MQLKFSFGKTKYSFSFFQVNGEQIQQNFEKFHIIVSNNWENQKFVFFVSSKRKTDTQMSEKFHRIVSNNST